MEISRASIIRKIKSHGAVLFGAGDFARNFYKDFKDDMTIKYCITNNPAETVFRVKHTDICPIYQISQKVADMDEMIIVCARLYADMMTQLNAYGLIYGVDYIDSEMYRVLMSGEKIAVFYGACYMRSLYHCLQNSKDFTEAYYPFYFLNYHRLSPYDNERFLFLRKNAGLYICHDEMAAKGIAFRSQLKSDCQVLRVPLVGFNGYHPRSPEKIGMDNVYSIVPNSTAFGTFVTPDDNVNRFIQEGRPFQEILKIILDEDFYEKEYLEQNFRKEIRKIQLSEMRSDVAISDYILQYNGKARLFLNEKHMSNFVILELAKRMLTFLELPQMLPESDLMERQLLYTTEVPLYPSVIKNLSLNIYRGNPRYRLFTFGKEVDVTFEEYYERYYNYSLMMKKCMEEGYFPMRNGVHEIH